MLPEQPTAVDQPMASVQWAPFLPSPVLAAPTATLAYRLSLEYSAIESFWCLMAIWRRQVRSTLACGIARSLGHDFDGHIHVWHQR